MGLDISAMSNLKDKSDKYFTSDWEVYNRENGEHVKGDFYVGHINESFPDVADDIKNNHVYSYEKCEGHRAGSYGTYNQWRSMLCEMALSVSPSEVWGDEEFFKGKAFVELINFSDCEGVIGSITCEKLYRDFVDFKDMAKNYSDNIIEGWGYDDDYFYSRYCDWMNAFEIGSKNGCVEFH